MISFFLSWFSVMFAMVFSPGPANIVLAAAGAKQGFRKSIPLAVGIDIVFFIKSCLIGFGLAEVFQRHPHMLSILRWAGVIYLVWLALRFLNTSKSKNNAVEPRLGFAQGVILQSLNAKGWLLVALMFSLFAEPSRELWGINSTVLMIVMLTILNISVHLSWVAIGATLGHFTSNSLAERRMNQGFFAALMLTALWLGWTA